MNRLIAAAIIISTLTFGLLHAVMGLGFNHALHGSMDRAAGCMMGACPASTHGSDFAATCAQHCLQTAATEQNIPPVFPLLLVLAFVLLSFGLGSNGADRLTEVFRRFSDSCSRLLLRQKLATIVLRN